MTVKISKRILSHYLAAGRELFPLCRDEERGETLPVKEQGKKPLHNRWRDRTYDEGRLAGYVADGHNLGWRLGPRDLVIDVDPRNGGNEGLARLCDDLKVSDVSDFAPTVRTGGGGFHYYFRLPKGTRPKLLRAKLPDRYPGIDFKRAGGYVVIAGSWHYGTGRTYDVEDLSPWDSPAPLLPESLLDRLSRPESAPARELTGEADLSPEELAEVLGQLPVEDFDENDNWFPLLCAAHYATAGEGEDEFVAWSVEDPRFADDEPKIRDRWRSLRTGDLEVATTTGTLLKVLRDHGGTPPERLRKHSAAEEFGQFLSKKPETLRGFAEALSPDSTPAEIDKVLHDAAEGGDVSREIVVRIVAEKTRLPRKAIRDRVRAFEKKAGKKRKRHDDEADLRDLVQQVAALLIRTEYDDGETLKYCSDGQWWRYDGRKWSPYFEGFIDRDVYRAILDLRREDPDAEFDAARAITPTRAILRAKLASTSAPWDYSRGRPSVVNTYNCELWINRVDGTFRKKRHAPESGLAYCIDDVRFDRDAECPLYDETIQEIFAKEEDPDDVVRHWNEIVGYLLQPEKDLASWFLLVGSGANGKSVLLKILSALLGDAALEQGLADFAAGNQFARAALVGKLAVIDDDLPARAPLPDDFMKKISESKTIAANQKYGPVIRFVSTAAIVAASNELPTTRDASYGLLRRANVIPFRRTFRGPEIDSRRADRIIRDELPGVLNEALRGLRRLRERGHFLIPRACARAVAEWRADSSPVLGFLRDETQRSRRGTAKLESLYALYSVWTADNGIDPRYRLDRRAFSKALRSAGYVPRRGSRGKTVFHGLTITGGDHD